MNITAGRSLLSGFGVPKAELEQITRSPSSATAPAQKRPRGTTTAKEPVAVVPKPTTDSSKKSAKGTGGDSIQRSRERNRVHARKTRERKKNQMKTLQTRAEELKEEQLVLRQQINEKSTASILVGLFATAGENDEEDGSKPNEDPEIEALLRRPTEEIPDASKITELPALILPGQHNSKKAKAFDAFPKDDLPDDGIDYDLLGKDRSKCTPEELDKIRRERNRMHAKRTRDRKRLFMEEMSEMCKKLEEENALLRNHLRVLDGDCPAAFAAGVSSSSESPRSSSNIKDTTKEVTSEDNAISKNGVTMDQLKTLIEAAGTFEATTQTMKGIMSLSSVASSVATAVSASDSNDTSANASETEDHDETHQHQEENGRSAKRRRLGSNSALSALRVPRSITASSATVEV